MQVRLKKNIIMIRKLIHKNQENGEEFKENRKKIENKDNNEEKKTMNIRWKK